MAGDWLTRDQIIDGKGKGVCSPSHTSYGGATDYSGARYPVRDLFRHWARAPFFLLLTGWTRTLGREEERHQSMSHPSSVSQGVWAPSSLSSLGRVQSPLPASFFLSVREMTKPALPNPQSGWDGDSEVSEVCLTASKWPCIPPAKSLAGEGLEPAGHAGDRGFLWLPFACQPHLAKAREPGLEFAGPVSMSLDAASTRPGLRGVFPSGPWPCPLCLSRLFASGAFAAVCQAPSGGST